MPSASPTNSTYGITRLVIGEVGFIEISGTKFAEIQLGHKLLHSALGIEQRFDVAVENHYEFEQELLRSSLDQMLFQDTTWRSLIDKRLTLSRRLTNVLSACSLYVSQLRVADKAINEKLSLAKRKIYAESFEYRFGRQLRNFMTHHAFDAHRMSRGAMWHGEMQPEQCSFVTDIALRVEEMAEYLKRDRHLLAELTTRGEWVDLVGATRGYVQAVGMLHEEAREVLNLDVAAAKELFQWTLEQGKTIGLLRALDVVARTATSQSQQSVVVSQDPLDYLGALQRKNRAYATLSSRYVTSQLGLDLNRGKRPPR